MRFAIVAAAVISLSSSVLATSTTFIKPSGGHKYECRRWSRVNWKKFGTEKKTATLLLKDARGGIIHKKRVKSSAGWADVYIPEYFERVAKFVLVDVSTNVVFAEGEEFAIDCPSRKPWENKQSWEGKGAMDAVDSSADGDEPEAEQDANGEETEADDSRSDNEEGETLS